MMCLSAPRITFVSELCWVFCSLRRRVPTVYHGWRMGVLRHAGTPPPNPRTPIATPREGLATLITCGCESVGASFNWLGTVVWFSRGNHLFEIRSDWPRVVVAVWSDRLRVRVRVRVTSSSSRNTVFQPFCQVSGKQPSVGWWSVARAASRLDLPPTPTPPPTPPLSCRPGDHQAPVRGSHPEGRQGESGGNFHL